MQEGRLRTLRSHPEKISAPAFGIGLLIVWEVVVRAANVPEYLMPGPIAIFKQVWNIIFSGRLAPNLFITLKEVLFGYVIAIVLGITLGTLISQVRLIEKAFKPLIIAFGAVPKIALGPLFIIWFGFGITSKIVLSALCAFFPLLINTMNGLNAVDKLKTELFRSLGANRWQTFWNLKAPNALPYIFAGLDIGAVFSVSGAIVGEFVGSQGGLGHMALAMQYEFNIPGYFAVLLVIVPLGIIMHSIVTHTQKRLIFWVADTRR